MTHSHQETPTRRQCIHCRAPLYVDAFDPRWRGYCHECIRRLLRQRHPESA
jgi:hypothetical protein